MTDFDSLQTVIDNLSKDLNSNTKLLFVIGALLLTDILLTAVRIFFDFRLKRLEKNIFSANQKEEKRIKIYEDIYQKIDLLTYVEPRESETILIRVTEIDRYISRNYLYISKDVTKVINEYCDYYRQVSTDYRKKNIKTESTLIQRYKSLFNA